MKYLLMAFLFSASAQLLTAQLAQPEFNLTDVNPSSSRNTGLGSQQTISPRQYRQQISVYYFSQEWCHICQDQFTALQDLSNELKNNTDLPIVFTGIHLFQAATNSAMYDGKSLSWVRETEAIRPWQSWRVPLSSRPAQEIRWRDVIILDENNVFFAVQNLTDTPITVPANRTRLKNTLTAAATIVDSDSDGINDRWEFSELGSIDFDYNTITESGHAALTAYAFSLPRGQSSFSLDPVHGLYQNNGQNYIQIQFRRRLGLEASRLGYLPQTSMDLLAWRHNPTDWTETSRVNPYDGSGTEIVTVRRTAPMTGVGEFARLQIGQE